jgi:hypothetical protein
VPTALTPHSTSYFSAPHQTLDPDIFTGTVMKPAFRRVQLQDVMRFLHQRWANPEGWCHLWLAGSSASYQWSGTSPGDLDLLIGVDYDVFRRSNDGFGGVSNSEISGYLNRVFQAFNGRWVAW